MHNKYIDNMLMLIMRSEEEDVTIVIMLLAVFESNGNVVFVSVYTTGTSSLF